MRVFNIDISRKGISPVVQVTEYDAMSRFFTLVLRNGSSDYEPPENPTYSVWYKTKDSTGWYDTITLPDESTRPAVVADGNAFTVEIAEQATTSCGELALMINGDDGYQLTVSGIITRSDDIPGYDGQEVENYYNVYITEMRENAARAENAADIAVAYGATVEVDEAAQQLNITHHSDTEGGVGWLFGSAIMTEASGSVAAFPDGANDVAVKSLVAEITPVQDLNGQSNPYPAGGGVNLVPCFKDYESTSSGLTVTPNADGSVRVRGTATNTSAVLLSQKAVSIPLTAGTYTFYNGISASANKVYAQAITSAHTFYSRNAKDTFTLAEDTTITRLDIGINAANGEQIDVTIYPQFESGSTATAFAPYSNICPISGRTGLTVTVQSGETQNTYPISWQTQAGTVYGGTLDVVSGVLTVNGVLHTLTGNENFSLAISSRRFTKAFTALGWERANTVLSTQNQSNSVCSHATYLTGATGTATPADYRISTDSGNVQALNFYDTQSEFANAAAFNAYLAEQYANGTPVQLYYDLATPLEPIQLTPTEVRTLLGGNTIYTDAGSVSVDYIADTKLYIDNKIAELQALVLEN